MSASSAFNDEKGGSSSVGEPEYGHDPASGGIFSSDYKRYGAPPAWVPLDAVSICHIVGGGVNRTANGGGGAVWMWFPVC